jgi:hydrogenase maturation protease
LKTIVIGLGNPILGDDGAGWKVVEELKASLPEGIDIDALAGGGLSLMERLVGYDHAIIVDTLNTGEGTKGKIWVFSLQSLPNPFLGHLGSAHETNLMTALDVGRSLGAHLPDRVTVVGIESPGVYDFGESLSPEIEGAIPGAVQAVLEILQS